MHTKSTSVAPTLYLKDEARAAVSKVSFFIQFRMFVKGTSSDALRIMEDACFDGDATEAERLLAAGADVNAPFSTGWTPLMDAAANGHEALVRVLLVHRAALDSADAEGNTALMLACANGHEGAVSQLRAAGANSTLVNRDGDTAEAISRRFYVDRVREGAAVLEVVEEDIEGT